MWFEKLTGFKEESPEQVRENLEAKDGILSSKVNGKTYYYGKLELPSLEELRSKSKLNEYKDNISISELVGNVQDFHRNPENEGALFQAASQFNLLEMVGPHVIPERGVDIYEKDYTQGPACAIACGAGTIFRNYFTEVNGQIGQTEKNQIDCLKDIGIELNNEDLQLWDMKNGYALATTEGLLNINKQIKSRNDQEYEYLKGKLRIGVQWNTEVTLSETKHKVTQAYCSALPVAYSRVEQIYWENFARLALEATYEATLHTALLNYSLTGNNKVFLTMVGGGAFGNAYEWILDAIKNTLQKFSKTPLDVRIVSFGKPDPKLRTILNY